MRGDGSKLSMAVTEMSGINHENLHPWRSLVSTNMGSLSSRIPAFFNPFSLAVFAFAMLLSHSQAVLLDFQNCLTPGERIASTGETLLQWVPLGVWVDIDPSTHLLNMTVYGNVTGQSTREELPAWDNTTHWDNPNQTLGKITDLDPNSRKYSTLFARLQVLNYLPYSNSSGVRFLNTTFDTDFPIAPVFENRSSVEQYPAFTYDFPLDGSYGFTTLNPRLWVLNSNEEPGRIACVDVRVTPFLGNTVEGLLGYLPLLVLVLVGIATASAAIFSPWGTWDIFRWTSNYGRDAIQLRLITPGFGDCLQYIQFVVLSGSLSLNYPGFYQPAVSQVSWSSLMFNESFVTHGSGTEAVVDGVYAVSGTYGLNITSQLVGMTSDQDMWAGMMIWLLVIIAAVSVLAQVGFLGRWIYRLVTKTQEEDMRAKNWPFTAGNAVRIVFNYFLLPIVALSMYQLAIAGKAPPSYITVAFAAITIIVVLAFSGYLLWLIITARPRSWLFDDLPTVLLYGPLYNTYSDNAAPFALVPVIITFIRGIAIGAVQSSGIAQIVLLSICEIINVMALNAFRPFSSPTSMNAYHTVFSVVRLVTVLLMVAFVPSLNIDDATRGWIGYVILLLHAITLFVGFFLHSLQTGIEVIARMAGAGGEGDTTAMGGFVRAFGLRQLSRRNKARAKQARSSTASNQAMLDQQEKIIHSRSRSMSASSNLLLNNRSPLSDPRQSVALDSVTGGGHSHTGSVGNAYTPSTPGGGQASALSYGPNSTQVAGAGALANLKSMEPSDPYFRAPRPRRPTVELPPMGAITNSEWATVATTEPEDKDDAGEGPSASGRATPAPGRERADSIPDKPKTDYATREVDYYYGVRGPALSHMPTRKLKTGPADPTGPVSSATGWFKNIFGGKTKEQGKGFEVIRSSRMPPQEQAANERGIDLEPYRDDPSSPPQVKERTRHFELDDEGDAVGGGTRRLPVDEQPQVTAEGVAKGFGSDGGAFIASSKLAPVLPAIDAGSSIHIPSRMPSAVSSMHPSRANTRRRTDEEIPEVPEVPRKSSKRTPSSEPPDRSSRLPVIESTPPNTAQRRNDDLQHASSLAPHQRLPFSTLDPAAAVPRVHNRSRSGDSRVSALSTLSNENEEMTTESRGPEMSPPFREDRPSSLGYVQQHRASDNIHIVNESEQTLRGSTAELVDGNSTAGDTTTDRPGH